MVVCFLFALPMMIFIHEVGHYVAARSQGFEARLSFAQVNFFVTPEQHAGIEGLIVTLAGPGINYLLAAIAVFGLYLMSKRSRQARWDWWVIAMLSVVISGGCRGFKAIDHHGSDEEFISKAMGMPGSALPWLMMIPTAFLLYYLVRFHIRQRSMRLLLLGWLAGMAGVVLWMKVVGPVVLPAPDPESKWIKRAAPEVTED